jgi:hypothetical protein
MLAAVPFRGQLVWALMYRMDVRLRGRRGKLNTAKDEVTCGFRGQMTMRKAEMFGHRVLRGQARHRGEALLTRLGEIEDRAWVDKVRPARRHPRR